MILIEVKMKGILGQESEIPNLQNYRQGSLTHLQEDRFSQVQTNQMGISEVGTTLGIT